NRYILDIGKSNGHLPHVDHALANAQAAIGDQVPALFILKAQNSQTEQPNEREYAVNSERNQEDDGRPSTSLMAKLDKTNNRADDKRQKKQKEAGGHDPPEHKQILVEIRRRPEAPHARLVAGRRFRLWRYSEDPLAELAKDTIHEAPLAAPATRSPW